MKRSRLNRHALLGVALIALAPALTMLSGCGSSSNAKVETARPVDGAESAYCDTHRRWAVHELAGDPDSLSTPAARRKYWNEALIYQETALQQAPPVIRAQWVVNERAVRTLQTPLFEKYDFDFERIDKQGTPAEKAILEEPPPDVQKAQAAINAYEDKVCGTGSPPAADVVFKADGSSKAFCTANTPFNNGFEKVASAGWDPAALRTFATGESFTKVLGALDATAPAQIAPDVKAVTEWFRTRWSEVVGNFDYDYRRLLLDGTPEDRAVFNRFHPDIVEHWSRTKAYVEQVCTAP